MPLNAKFTADFSSFYEASQRAETAMRSFAGTAEKVSTSLNKMVDPNVVDRTQKLGAGFQATADKGSAFVGVLDRVVERLAIYASVRGAIHAVETTIRWGQELHNLSEELNVTTVRAQELSFAALKTGTPLESVTEGVSHLQQAIGSRDSGLLNALTRLGISFETIRSTSTEGALNTIVAKMAQVKDQFEFAGDAADLFGARAGRRLGEIIRNWDNLRKAAHESSAILSEEQTQALEKAAQQWDILILKGKAYLADVILAIGKAVRDTRGGLQTAGIMAGALPGVAAPTAPGSPANPFTLPQVKAPALTDPMLAYFDAIAKRLEDETRDQIEAARAAEEAIHGLKIEWASFHEFTLTNIGKIDEALKKQQENLMRGFEAVNAAVVAEFQARAGVNASRGQDIFGNTAIKDDAAMTMQKKLDELHRTNPEGVPTTFREQAIIDDFNKAVLDEANALTASLIPSTEKTAASVAALAPAADAVTAAFAKFSMGGPAFTAPQGAFGPNENPTVNVFNPTAHAPSILFGAARPGSTAGMFANNAPPSLFQVTVNGVMATDEAALNDRIARGIEQALRQMHRF